MSLLLLLLLCWLGWAADAAGPTVSTSHGPVTGEVVTQNGTRVNVFRSIPFGAPPVGALRFRTPVPPTPWTTPRDVTPFGTSCPQLKIAGGLLVGAEDCLQLAVYAPEGVSNAPVMVWIYGGAFILGDAWEFGIYDGTALAAATGHVIVAPNYRVGPFGFMALPELQAEDAGHSTGNAAMQDQVLALHWVQDNIAQFGGDASRVTIAGESVSERSARIHRPRFALRARNAQMPRAYALSSRTHVAHAWSHLARERTGLW